MVEHILPRLIKIPFIFVRHKSRFSEGNSLFCSCMNFTCSLKQVSLELALDLGGKQKNICTLIFFFSIISNCFVHPVTINFLIKLYSLFLLDYVTLPGLFLQLQQPHNSTWLFQYNLSPIYLQFPSIGELIQTKVC